MYMYISVYVYVYIYIHIYIIYIFTLLVMAHMKMRHLTIARIYSAVATRVKKRKTATHMNESRRRSPADSAVFVHVCDMTHLAHSLHV